MNKQETIRLTDLNESFIEDYLLLVNDPVVASTTEPGSTPRVFSKAEILTWLCSLKDKENRKDFAIVKETTGEFVGEVVLNQIKSGMGNIRIAILPIFFDLGFGSTALRLAIDYAFLKLNLEKITLGVYEINPRALKVYKRLGFVEVGKEVDEGLVEIMMELNKQNW
ncbi:GNAT family protein [Halobacteriovorax sp. GB3]|uniref:GNAT family N-acetyltransferase n=1 Tax=Halobacteriovorax sp. GB3 TaxID=2719615 RepID=UPI0023610336|nr:GNAT family protein [Halobacteriovorax sp. GB3]MDD0853624.1 GNAT family protein [Halobacteriovorax sp. GB3]